MSNLVSIVLTNFSPSKFLETLILSRLSPLGLSPKTGAKLTNNHTERENNKTIIPVVFNINNVFGQHKTLRRKRKKSRRENRDQVLNEIRFES